MTLHPIQTTATPARHILAVEDDLIDQEIIRQACAMLGWSASITPDVQQALHWASLYRPQIVLIDATLYTACAASLAMQLRAAIRPPEPTVLAWSYAPVIFAEHTVWWDRWILKSTAPPAQASVALFHSLYAIAHRTDR